MIHRSNSAMDENADDPTLRRCKRFANDWIFGGIVMTNLFALRSTNPNVIYGTQNPEGDPENIDIIKATAAECAVVIACWGVHGKLRERDKVVMRELSKNRLKHIGLTKAGHPRHPLYLPSNAKMAPLPQI